jgi:hypothetical protein
VARALDQDLGEVVKDSPITRTIGIREGAVRDRGTETQMIDLVGSGTEAGFQIGQAVAESNLGESHGEKLIAAGKGRCLIDSGVTIHTATKLLGMDALQNLGEDEFSRVHSRRMAWRLLDEIGKLSSNQSHWILEETNCRPAGFSDPFSP